MADADAAFNAIDDFVEFNDDDIASADDEIDEDETASLTVAQTDELAKLTQHTQRQIQSQAESQSKSAKKQKTSASHSQSTQPRTQPLALPSQNLHMPDSSVRRKMKARFKVEDQSVRGVVYLTHVPYGLNEHNLPLFASQFGQVHRCRVVRNARTGRSRHAALIEFAHMSVAQIVAQSLHNYMLFGATLQARVIQERFNYDSLFARKVANRMDKTKQAREKQIKRTNRIRTQSEQIKREALQIKRQKRKQQEMQQLGINYSVPEAVPVATAESS